MTTAKVVDSRQLPTPARVIRVLLGSAGSIALAIAGLRYLLQARHLAEAAGVNRPEFLELGLRSCGISLLAAAQVVVVLAVLRAHYPVRRGDRVFGFAMVAVLIVGAVGAILFGLSSR
jgi:hypothetical protein